MDTIRSTYPPPTRCGMAKENAEMRVRYDSEKDNKGHATKKDSSEIGFDEDDGRLKVIENSTVARREVSETVIGRGFESELR